MAHSTKQPKLTPQLQRVHDAFWDQFKPVDRRPAWQWCEEHLQIASTEGAFPGAFRTDLTPMVRPVYEAAQNPMTRRLVIMVSAQSSKTIMGLNMLAWAVRNDPATTMWIMASKDNCEEFLRKRMEPHFLSSDTLRELWPTAREHRTLRLIQFRTMNLLLRGSNSRIGLQSDPVRRIICDERREWKEGAIDLVRERMKTFHNALEISMGTAGEENDQLHRDYLDGSQTVFVWSCLHCGKEQPFRWSTKATPVWPEIKQGGVVWETSTVTKPGGHWDYEAVKPTVGYQCEGCGFIYRDSEKFALLPTLTMRHGNPDALPERPSFHWNELYMPWSRSAWPELVVKFLKAKSAIKRGEIMPMQTFVTETCGEPWRAPSESVDNSEVLLRKGRYRMGEPWPVTSEQEKTIGVITVDVQQGHVVVVYRQWRQGGVSRLAWAGIKQNLADVYTMSVNSDVKPQCVFVDCSYNRSDVERECLRYGWNPIEGDEHARFTLPDPVVDPDTRKPVRVQAPWTYKRIDPYRGTSSEGRQFMRSFVWSNPTYMERLYFYTLRGLTASWEIPLDIAEVVPDYLPQLMAYERTSKTDEQGAVTYAWVHRGRRHDYADAELMQLAAADICYITRTETIAAPVKASPAE